MTSNSIKFENSSFRDNLGNVYYFNNKVLRTVSKEGKENYEFLKTSEILKNSIISEFLINTNEIDKKYLPKFFTKFDYVLESELIPFISYPYEWTFDQLKKAALHHLEFQIFLFKKGAVLRDASAYNIQFIGSKPYFIDVLSIKPYEDGEYWIAYKQFCENFLNPLLLGYLKGVQHNNWFRGSLEGVDTIELNNILNLIDKISINVFIHVHLQAKLNKKSLTNPNEISLKYKKLKKLSKKSYISILYQLKNWISKMSFRKQKSIWQNYSQEHTYDKEEYNEKKLFVADFIKKRKPKSLIDLGCNTGEFSNLALNSGVTSVVGFDFDHNVISRAFNEAFQKKKNFLPLVFDAANPSPNQGWDQIERKGFLERFRSEALLALAFEHHLIIGKNIPILKFINWIVKVSKNGIIEFVPKSDETIQKMLEFREDIFHDYSQENFEKCLLEKSNIINKTVITKTGRILYEYEVL